MVAACLPAGLRSASRDPQAGYSIATVLWSGDDDDSVGIDDDLAYTRRTDARARSDEEWEAMGEDAMALLGLVNTWIGLIREQGREKQEGQLDQVLEDLGPMPSPLQRPGALSMWVGALINPLPSLGVAYEVRPALLKACSSEERIALATDAIDASIEYLRLKE